MEEIVKLIPESVIKECLTMERTVQLCEKLFTVYGQGKVIMPAKLAMPLGAHGAWPGNEANLTCLPVFPHCRRCKAPIEFQSSKDYWYFWGRHAGPHARPRHERDHRH